MWRACCVGRVLPPENKIRQIKCGLYFTMQRTIGAARRTAARDIVREGAIPPASADLGLRGPTAKLSSGREVRRMFGKATVFVELVTAVDEGDNNTSC